MIESSNLVGGDPTYLRTVEAPSSLFLALTDLFKRSSDSDSYEPEQSEQQFQDGDEQFPITDDQLPIDENGGDPNRSYAVLCHIAAPLIWPIKRKQSPAVDEHGKAALNHMIAFGILFTALHLVLGVLIHVFNLSQDLRSMICVPVLMIAAVFSLWGLVKAGEGVLIRYPLPFRFIK
jgi:uncharacterized Tic20 family protein